MTRRLHVWTEEDVAYAAAQWASGITQKEISEYYGYANSSVVCSHIRLFIQKYTPVELPD